MPEQPIAVMSAMPQEIAHFSEAFTEESRETHAGFLFRRGTMDGHPVILAESGIGKVNAAIVATLLLDRLGCRAIVFSGVAGGVDPALQIGDVVVATRLVQHDYGAMIDRQIKPYQPGVPPLPGFPEDLGFPVADDMIDRLRQSFAAIELPELPAAVTGGAPRVPALHFGTVLTGDLFLNCEATRQDLFDRYTAQAVEMEGASVAQVAERYGAPLIVLRALSDLAGAESHMDFGTFVDAAAVVSSRLVKGALAVV